MESGQRLGDYTLLEPLGRGGFGEVWKAEHRDREGKWVAVKVATHPDFTTSLRKEAAFQLALDHPNVVRTLEVHLDHDPAYFVMEYIPGESLREVLRQRARLPAMEAVGIVCKVLAGLEAAHRVGLLHRDVKPENVMVTPEGGVRLSDFGLGKATKAAALSIEVSGRRSLHSADLSIVGTYDYMAPEQRRGEDAGAQTDVYACGVLLFEMLTGEAHPIRLPILGASEELSEIVGRATETRPEHRYASASEMREAADEAVWAPVQPSPKPRNERPASARPPRSFAFWAISILVGGALLMWGGGWIALKQPPWEWGGGQGSNTSTAPPPLSDDARRRAACGPERDTIEWLLLSNIHQGGASRLVWSPDGRVLATCGHDRMVRLWSVPDGRAMGNLVADAGEILWLAFRPASDVFATAHADGTIRLWGVPGGKLLATGSGNTGAVHAIAFSSSGDLLWSVGADGRFLSWSVPTLAGAKAEFESASALTALAASADGKRVAVGDAEGSLRAWTWPEMKPLLEEKGGDSVSCLDFHPDGDLIAAGRDGGQTEVWSITKRAKIQSTVGQHGRSTGVAFGPDGMTLATSLGQGFFALHTLKSVEPFLVRGGNLTPQSYAFGLGGKALAAIQSDGNVKVMLLQSEIGARWPHRWSKVAPAAMEVTLAGGGVVRAGKPLWVDVKVMEGGTGVNAPLWLCVDSPDRRLNSLCAAFGLHFSEGKDVAAVGIVLDDGEPAGKLRATVQLRCGLETVLASKEVEFEVIRGGR